ncbi:DUF4328 domain-containing protein [Kribbella solani]|uniref:DUF4328 domain-containing protein n=1 Tax=Kribbella solani TaxID=236067 RepID=UPI0029AD528C|nr:DUF4328 domain-containing protein [Kribbella solani]MDX2968934.1 DUF4328 domain-containing protein [Kribbella solani]
MQPYPVPHQPGPYQPPPVIPRYRPLKPVAIVSIVLIGLTAVAAVVQSVLMWRSYDEVKRLIYGLLTEDEINSNVETIAGVGPFLNLVSYLLIGTGIAFMIWLWQARENTDFLYSPFAPRPAVPADPVQGPHRRAAGWIVGSWFCPIVQFWYPLQIVQDIAAASEPPEQPGAGRSGRMRMLLTGWWATWTGFWVIVVGGGSFAAISFIVWFIRLVQVADSSDPDSPYVDIYDMQDFMVRVALAVDIGFTVAAVLLIVAGVAAAFMMLRITDWQHLRATTPPPAQWPTRPPEPPRYAPRFQPPQAQPPGPGFPSYGP